MDSPVMQPEGIPLTGETNKERLIQALAALKEQHWTIPYVSIDITFFYPDKQSPCLATSTGLTTAFFAAILQRAFNTMEPGLIEPGALEMCDTLQTVAEHNRSLAN